MQEEQRCGGGGSEWVGLAQVLQGGDPFTSTSTAPELRCFQPAARGITLEVKGRVKDWVACRRSRGVVEGAVSGCGVGTRKAGSGTG